MRFVVECYLGAAPDLASIEAAAREAASDLALRGNPIEHVRSTFVADDEMCFHVFDACSPDTVRRASIQAGLDPIRIVAAVETGPVDKTPGR